MNDHYTCWKELLTEALRENGETWQDVESNTMTEAEMEKSFDSGSVKIEGLPFTVWTVRSVYFPVVHDDGAESVGWVSRYPDGKPTDHIGW